MQCPTCGRELLEGPPLSRTTHRLCLWCVRHFTLDGFEVVEPAEFWMDEAGLRWMHRWVSPTAHEIWTHREWLRWFRTTWLGLHPEG